jgi:hypothetical protein
MVAAPASAPLEPTQIAGNARGSHRAIAIADTRLAWEEGGLLGTDSEIFVADVAQPIAGSISLCPLTNPCQLTNDDADDVAPLRSGDFVVWQRKDLPGSSVSLHFSDGNQSGAVPGSTNPNAFLYRDSLSLSGSRLVWWGADGAGSDGISLADLAQPLTGGRPRSVR